MRSAVEDLMRSVDLEVQSFASSTEFLQSKRPDAPNCIVLDDLFLVGAYWDKKVARIGL